MEDADLTGLIIGCAIEVHKALGPGLLESAYHRCLKRKFAIRGIQFVSEAPIPIVYKGDVLESGFRADFIVQGRILLELKSVESITKVHYAQVLTYLKLTNLRMGLLINFNVTSLRHGLRRLRR